MRVAPAGVNFPTPGVPERPIEGQKRKRGSKRAGSRAGKVIAFILAARIVRPADSGGLT